MQTPCPGCSSDEVLSIEITVGGGTPLRFHSCQRCEQRWWQHEDRVLSLDQVLALAARKDRID